VLAVHDHQRYPGPAAAAQLGHYRGARQDQQPNALTMGYTDRAVAVPLHELQLRAEVFAAASRACPPTLRYLKLRPSLRIRSQLILCWRFWAGATIFARWAAPVGALRRRACHWRGRRRADALAKWRVYTAQTALRKKRLAAFYQTQRERLARKQLSAQGVQTDPYEGSREWRPPSPTRAGSSQLPHTAQRGELAREARSTRLPAQGAQTDPCEATTALRIASSPDSAGEDPVAAPTPKPPPPLPRRHVDSSRASLHAEKAAPTQPPPGTQTDSTHLADMLWAVGTKRRAWRTWRNTAAAATLR